MASVTVQRPEPLPPATISLEMSEEEALIVLGLLGPTTGMTEYHIYQPLFDGLVDLGHGRSDLYKLSE